MKFKTVYMKLWTGKVEKVLVLENEDIDDVRAIKQARVESDSELIPWREVI